jgi:hypothetical protein
VKLREKLLTQQDAYNEKMNTYENEISDTRENLTKIQKEYLVEKRNNENSKETIYSLNRVVRENVVIVDGLKEEVICILLYLFGCIYICVYIYIYLFMYIYIYVYIYMYIYIYKYMFMVYVYVCVYVWLCIYV